MNYKFVKKTKRQDEVYIFMENMQKRKQYQLLYNQDNFNLQAQIM